MLYSRDIILTCMKNLSIFTFIHLNLTVFSDNFMNMSTPPPQKKETVTDPLIEWNMCCKLNRNV